MASLPPTHAHAKRRDVSVESALSDSTYPRTATHGPSRRGPGGIDTPHPPPLDVFGTDLSRLAQDDRATPTGLLELDPDTPTTSGSETDEPWPPPRSASHSSSARQPLASRRRASSARPVSHGRGASHRASWHSRGPRPRTTGVHGSPMAFSSRPFRTIPSFSSPLALAPVLPEDEDTASPSSSGSSWRASSDWTRRHAVLGAASQGPPSRRPPRSTGPHETKSPFLLPKHALHRRAHSAYAVPRGTLLCGSPVGGPEGIDPGLIAAIQHDTPSLASAPATRRSISLAQVHAAPTTPPLDAMPSPLATSPRIGRDTIRLQRMPRSVAMANDPVIRPPSQARDAPEMSSPLPSPVDADGMSRPTILGLALALPGHTSWHASAPPPEHADALLDARILCVSRETKMRRWHRQPQGWDDAWHRHASTHGGQRAGAHCDAVRQSLAQLHTSSAQYARLNDGIRVTCSLPELRALRRANDPPASKRDMAPRSKPRVVSEKVTTHRRTRPKASVDDASATQREWLWDELVRAKALCDAELDKTLAGLLRLSDDLLDPVDPDTTSVVVPVDGPMPLSPIERLASIAADIRSTKPHALLDRPQLCVSAVTSVQSLGAIWDAHPLWPGRGWYVELLLTLAGLSRVLGWWNAEHRFWSDDEMRPHGQPVNESKTTRSPSPASSDAPMPSSILLELSLDLRIEFVSTVWQRIVGTEPASTYGEPVSSVLASGNAALLERATRQLLESPGHTVEVALDIAVAGTPSADDPLPMTAQGMMVHHHGTPIPSHTMWVLHARQKHEPSTGEMRQGGAIGGMSSDMEAVPTDLVLCRICESDVPAWFFAKHSEMCHELHRLELSLHTCNETLWALIEAASAVRTTLSQGAVAAVYRDHEVRLDAEAAAPMLDAMLDGLNRAMSISTPHLPDDAMLTEGMRLLSPRSNGHVLSLKTWSWDRDTTDTALLLLYEDVSEAIRTKIHAVNRMCNTMVYVETVRQESEDFVASLMQDDHDEAANTTLHIHDEPAHPPVIVDTAPDEMEDTLAGVNHLLLDPIDDASDDDAWSGAQHAPMAIPRSTLPSNPELLSTPPLSPYVSTSNDSKSPRFGTSVGSFVPSSPHVLPPAQTRATATSIRDFELLKPISKGAYGSVFLAKKRTTGDIFAIKILKKADMIAKNQITNVRAERMILMNRTQSPFVVKLFFTFQSPEYLYLVMEYLPGGDCASLVKTLGALPDEWAQQYLAEMVQGLDYLHSTGVVHRDMKPDNLLIDHHGHLKLTDFGLSKLGLLGRHRPTPHTPSSAGDLPSTWAASRPGSARLSSPVPFTHVPDAALGISPMSDSPPQTEQFFRSMSQGDSNGRIVGTPDYLAPESILGVGMDDFGVDWWAVGVILFEFLHGYPPFHADTPADVFDRILSRQIAWDSDIPIAPEAYDLMNRLMCMDRKQRLGANGVEEIKTHPYFHGIDWAHLTDTDGPFVPQLTDMASTDYFDARGAVPQLWHDDHARSSVSTDPIAVGGESVSSGSGTPNEFGAFSYKNLPVLKQANDDMLRRIRMECAHGSPSSPGASISSGSSHQLPTTPSSAKPQRSWSDRSRVRVSSAMSSHSDALKSVQRHILLADVNPVSRQVLQTMLHSIGAQTTMATDGADLVQLAMGDTLYDAIFIRLGMHGIDVQDGARMIKSTRNMNAHTPIVAIISGHTHIDVAGSVFDAVLPLPNSPSFISHLLTSLQHESSSSTHMLDEATNMALAQLAL